MGELHDVTCALPQLSLSTSRQADLRAEPHVQSFLPPLAPAKVQNVTEREKEKEYRECVRLPPTRHFLPAPQRRERLVLPAVSRLLTIRRPMYRHFCRAPSRSLSGHACLSCRRRFHAAHAQRQDAADDWFSNFNDLSVASDQNRKERRKEKGEKKGNEKDPSRQNADDGEQNSFATSLEQPNQEIGGGKTQNDVQFGKHNRQADDVTPTTKKDSGDASSYETRQTYESVLASLIAEQGGSSHTKTTGLSGEPQSSDVPRGSMSPTSGGLGFIRNTSPQEGVDHTSAARREREQPTGSATAVDDVRVGQGALSHGAGAHDSSQQHLSILGKARMVNQRPKWGGHTGLPEISGSSKASFDALRRADKVSPPPERPSTASSAKPWGFKAHQPNTGFADLPSDLEIGQKPENPAVSSPAEDSTAPHSGSFSGRLGFKKLRDLLFKAGAENENAKEPANDIQLSDAVNEGTPDRTLDSENAPVASLAASLGASKSERVTGGRRKKTPRALKAKREVRVRKVAGKTRGGQAPSANVEGPEEAGAHPRMIDSSAPGSEFKGQSLSEAMKGGRIAETMTIEPGSRAEEGEEHADDGDSGLPRVEVKDLHIEALNIPQPQVPTLSFGLDRVLFNQGVTSLQDRHSRVYNFDSYLENIMPVEEFDFKALQQYKTSSQDKALSELAKRYEKKYVGSTSSMTSTLSHFHYLLSDWRPINLGMLSRQFPENFSTFTLINRAPTAIFLRWKNGTYAIDADKEHDSGNILMMLGKSMEKLLTMSKSEYERYRKSDPREVTEEERNAPEAYQYTTMGDFLMRSQLDAHDPRLPGTGMFDIKTRAIASIRMSTRDYKPMLGYEIHSEKGQWESYEREYYDMLRSTMLKYMLQARMGRMDGIFLTYHNVERIFGFQYLPIPEIDNAMHGQTDRCLGDQEFKMSLHLLNKVMDQATAKFPEKSLRFHFETRASPVTALYIFAEPMEEEQIDKIQATSKAKIAEFERRMMGIETDEETSTAEEDAPLSPEPQDIEPEAAPKPDNDAPLYAATILIGSTVNGNRVQRPKNIKKGDTWAVEYLLKEIENPADAWATYESCKEKRRKTFASAVMGNDEGEAESPEDVEPNHEIHDDDGSIRKFDNGYLEALRLMAERGRAFRRKLDKKEKGQEKVIWREDALSSSPSEASEVKSKVEPEVKINGVDDYLQWMYQDQKPN